MFLDNLQIGAVLVLITEPRAILKIVKLSLAFSVDRMSIENIKINAVGALERSGKLIDVVTGKTSALTEGKMTVSTFIIGRNKLRVINPEIN